ncbi:MAG: alpha/beta fold hydrolase [Elusimicrobiota bacterium]
MAFPARRFPGTLAGLLVLAAVCAPGASAAEAGAKAEGPAEAAAQKPRELPAALSKKREVRELEGELVDIRTADGWTLSGRHFESSEEDKLTFILLHDARGRKQNWYWLARDMARRGIGYLAIDLRGHGLSQSAPEGQPSSWREFQVGKRRNDWDNMREDVAAAARFLTEKGVPEESIALGGANVGGSIALKYAALHPEIAMVFILSPGMSYREVLTVNAMRAYRDRPILLVVGDDDRRSSTETPILFEFAKRSVGEENATLMRVPRGHGTRMLYYSRKTLVPDILEWIDNPITVLEPDVSTDTLTSPGSEGAGLPSDDDLERIAEEPAHPADD